ncbi:MAG TPA: tetratricopeptide repeat protein [Rhodocyclaceae bacterium]|nr:tetratricopeptide repeat protein [Rhodocyclaceae bacterium]
MPRKLAALFCLCFAVAGAHAQSAAGAGKATSRTPPSSAEETPESDLTQRAVYDVLLGEIALQRGDLPVALGAWLDIARRSRDPKALARAHEIASYAKQYPLMLEVAREWVRIDPESTPAQQALTSALVLNNRTEELGAQLALLLERDKANLAGNLLRLPRLFARHPDKAFVQRLIEQLAQPYAGIAEAHAAVAMAAITADDVPKARTEAEQALQLRPDWEFAAILFAQTLSKESSALAIEQLERFVAANPNAGDARLTLARLLIVEKRFAAARSHLKRLIDDRPDDTDILFPAAMLALQEGDNESGKQILESLLNSRFPDKSSLHFFLGQIAEEQKQVDKALGHFGQVVAGEQFLPARFRMAQIQLQQGSLDKALKTLRETAGKTTAEQVRIAQAESALLREAKRFEAAFQTIETALRKQPDNVELLYDGALAAEKVGKFDVLERYLNALLKQKPDHAQALNALGYSLADRNIRIDEAARLIEKAAALLPKDPFIMDSLGWVQFRQGKLTEALATLAEAYRLRPDPEIAAHLGEILWRLNRREEAEKIWRDSASKNPDNEVLQEVIRRLLR